MYDLQLNTKCQKQNVFSDVHSRIISAYKIQIKKMTKYIKISAWKIYWVEERWIKILNQVVCSIYNLID